MPCLPRRFFARPTLVVAKKLLGARLHFNGRTGMIVETEAYIGQDDPACHATRGKTKHNAPMFAQPGTAYIYFTYGMHWCLNVVTEQEDFPAAVLIRGIVTDDGTHIDGPARTTKYFGLTGEQNELDLVTTPDFYIERGAKPPHSCTSRIGIRVGLDKMWRCVAEGYDTKKPR